MKTIIILTDNEKQKVEQLCIRFSGTAIKTIMLCILASKHWLLFYWALENDKAEWLTMNKDEFDANLILSVEPKQELNGSLEMLKN